MLSRVTGRDWVDPPAVLVPGRTWMAGGSGQARPGAVRAQVTFGTLHYTSPPKARSSSANNSVKCRSQASALNTAVSAIV